MLLDFDFMGVALPEVTLALLALFLLLATTYTKHFKVQTSLFGALAILGLTAILVFWQSSQTQTGFNGAFVRDRFSQLNKLLILFGAAGALILSFSYVRRGKLNFSEYPVLVLLATLGMMAMVSANSLMALYLGLELQSLALYVAAALDRDNAKSSEAGLKYFVLGALASGMLLYGCSLIYGFTGSIQFAEISNYLEHNNRDLGVAFGLVFILAGMAFKVSAAPFHMWTPDVYEGSPTPVTAFFAGAPKLAAIALLTRLVLQAFQPILFDWQQILIFVSIASMGLGAFAAIGQTNIKRLLAYSSIGNMGYCLVGLAAGTKAGVVSILVFMAIYLVTTLGAFACVIAMRRRGEVVEQISDLSGLALSHKGLAFVMAMLMFSLAGIPPFLGFFGKYFVFASAIQAHLVVLAVVGMIGSVIAAFYYLRIVKLIYFDPPPLVPLDRIDGEVKLVAYGAGAAILLLSFFGQNFIEIATAAAAVLLD